LCGASRPAGTAPLGAIDAATLASHRPLQRTRVMPSAFIAMIRRELGTTPGQLFAAGPPAP